MSVRAITAFLALGLALSAVSASPVAHDHAHALRAALPGTWHHDRGHPAHALFRRQATTDGAPYPAVGSPSEPPCLQNHAAAHAAAALRSVERGVSLEHARRDEAPAGVGRRPRRGRRGWQDPQYTGADDGRRGVACVPVGGHAGLPERLRGDGQGVPQPH